jgi:hypothetical protein
MAYKAYKSQFDGYVPVTEEVRRAISVLKVKWEQAVDGILAAQQAQALYKTTAMAKFRFRPITPVQTREQVKAMFPFDAYLFGVTGGRFRRDGDILYINEDSAALILEAAEQK